MQHLVGTTLGRYRLVKLLGVGGMGAVFRAQDPLLEQDVAIKVMHPHLAQGRGASQRFIKEARVARRLNHPGIVRFFDVGEQDSTLYIVMEFIPGDTLRQMLNRLRAEDRSLRLDEAVRLVRHVCFALDHAHSQGILHRDIKPENIMLKGVPANDLPYQPVVTDLGLARLGGRDITIEGVPMGTAAYMSPEQAQGRETDTRSDIYSLGILLFELAVGRLPFPARSLTEAIRCHTLEPPPRPRSLRPDLPLPLEALILQTLSKGPHERPRDAAALGRALDEVLARMPAVEQEANGAPPTGEPASLLPTYEQSLAEPPTPPSPSLFPVPAGLSAPLVVALLPDGSTRASQVPPEGLIVGRAPGAGLVLEDTYVSRRHLRVDIDEDRAEITDLQSTHGTWLGDNRPLPGIPEAWPADLPVRVGHTWLRLALPVPAADPSLSGLTHQDGSAVLASEIASSPGTGRVGLLLEQRTFSAVPGSPVTIPLTILNQGTVVDWLRLSVEGVPGAWLPGLLSSVRLLPEKHKVIPVTILPPRSPESEAGTYTLTLWVASEDDPKEKAGIEARLTVGTFSQWDSGLAPQRIRVGKRAMVEVRNRGNAPQTVTLAWQDRAGELAFDPPEAQLSIPPGGRAEVDFRAALRHRRWAGGEKLHPITATVSAPDGQAQTHSGEVSSRGLIPPWLLPAVGLLVAMAVAAALLLPPLLDRGTPTPELPPVHVVDTPTPEDVLDQARTLAQNWWDALRRGDVAYLLDISGVPFYYDDGLLQSAADLQAKYKETASHLASQPAAASDWERGFETVKEIRVTEISGLEEWGVDPSSDRVLTSVELEEDDVAALLIFANDEGLILYFRRTDGGLTLAGFWD